MLQMFPSVDNSCINDSARENDIYYLRLCYLLSEIIEMHYFEVLF